VGWAGSGRGCDDFGIYTTLSIYVGSTYKLYVRRFHSPATVETDAVSCGENYCFVRYSDETIIIMRNRKKVWEVINSQMDRVSRHRPPVIKFVKFVSSRHSNLENIIVSWSIGVRRPHLFYHYNIHTCALRSILGKRQYYIITIIFVDNIVNDNIMFYCYFIPINVIVGSLCRCYYYYYYCFFSRCEKRIFGPAVETCDY
jgi:hypothetical protein